MHFPLFTVFLEEFLHNLLTFIQISRGNILDLRLISRFLYSLSILLPAHAIAYWKFYPNKLIINLTHLTTALKILYLNLKQIELETKFPENLQIHLNDYIKHENQHSQELSCVWIYLINSNP